MRGSLWPSRAFYAGRVMYASPLADLIPTNSTISRVQLMFEDRAHEIWLARTAAVA